MASHSDELVTRINHADINCEIFVIPEYDDSGSEESLRTLITGIGDYLTRVVGSVPIDLKITLRVTHDPTPLQFTYDEWGWQYDIPETIGPFYYEGQGTGNVEER